MKTKIALKVTTIKKQHVEQLPCEHYWDGEYDWEGKRILGRIAHDGFILVQDKTGALHRISPIAYIDAQFASLGGRWRENGKWVYAPTPHTEYSRKAQAAYAALPQIFTE